MIQKLRPSLFATLLAAVSALLAFTALGAGTISSSVAPSAEVHTAVAAINGQADNETLELHAHLFMKEGMTWAASGNFNGPLGAKDWKALFASQANPESLDRSGLGVVVATLYAHPLFTISLRQSIRRQIALAERFVAEHPKWIIARDAEQARAALEQGKRVVVLALEESSGVLETEQDLKEFIDEKGIRIVNLLHMTDDQYGGVAFMPGFKAFATPWARLTQIFSPAHDSEGHVINANGLSDKGRALAESLIKRHVWLDLSHASDRSQETMVAMLKKAGMPLLYTHTVLRKYMNSERGINDAQLAQVRATEGVVGIMPSDSMLVGTVAQPAYCRFNCEKPCEGGLASLATQYAELAKVLRPDQIAFGSDYNGGVHHLPPTCGSGTAMDGQGLWNIGLQGSVWDALEKLGLPVPSPRRKIIDHFLDAWEKVNPTIAKGPAT